MIKEVLNNPIQILVSLLSFALTVLGVWLSISEVSGVFKLLLIVFGVIIVFLTIIVLVLIINVNKLKGYRNSFQHLNKAFAESHDIENPDTESLSLVEDMQILGLFCHNVKQAIEQTIDGRCSVCIKLLFYNKQTTEPFVITFVRDQASDSKRPSSKKDDETNTVLWLKDNTAFKEIFSVAGRAVKYGDFFNNNLPFLTDYENTRIKLIDNYPAKIKLPLWGRLHFIENLVKFFDWRLLYRSTIVVPIISYDDIQQSRSQMQGFLCIDSNLPWQFKKRYHVELLKGCADGIYASMRSIRRRHFKNEYETDAIKTHSAAISKRIKKVKRIRK